MRWGGLPCPPSRRVIASGPSKRWPTDGAGRLLVICVGESSCAVSRPPHPALAPPGRGQGEGRERTDFLGCVLVLRRFALIRGLVPLARRALIAAAARPAAL